MKCISISKFDIEAYKFAKIIQKTDAVHDKFLYLSNLEMINQNSDVNKGV